MESSDPHQRYCYDPKLLWNPLVQEYLTKAYGVQHFSRISKALTYPSCYTCIRVNTLKSTADDVMQTLMEVIPAEDVGKDRAISKCTIDGLDNVLLYEGSGPHSIQYGDGPVKEVIVSRKCAEAVLRGAQVYVPGVLACSANVEKGDKVAVSVAIEQLGADGGWGVGITRGITLQGSETGTQCSPLFYVL